MQICSTFWRAEEHQHISLGQYAVVSSVIVVLIYLKYGFSTLQIQRDLSVVLYIAL